MTKGRRRSPRRWVTFFFHENSTNQLRVGFTLSRKVGSAVLRNRLRRWGREFFRNSVKNSVKIGLQTGSRIDGFDAGQFEVGGFDINVVFRPMEPGFYQKLDHEELRQAFTKGLRMVHESLPITNQNSDRNDRKAEQKSGSIHD